MPAGQANPPLGRPRPAGAHGHRGVTRTAAGSWDTISAVLRSALMSVIGIDHVQLAMPAGQEERARAFYRDVLGVPETPKPADLAKRGGCWFESSHVRIHLGVDQDFRPATKAHPGLLVGDLQQL